MTNLSLSFQRVGYVTDRRIKITAWRALAEVAFLAHGPAQVNYSCIVDPGAPFSVIPFSLWSDRSIQWKQLGSRVKRQVRESYESLEWQGVLYDLGSANVRLVDSLSGIQTSLLVIKAKFPRQRQPRINLEMVAVLGMNFLIDNNLHLVLDGHKDSITGSISIA